MPPAFVHSFPLRVPSARSPPQNKPPPAQNGGNDPFYTYDYWPMPASWCSSLFRDEFWNVEVRKYGADAMKMGPLDYGTRTVIGDPKRIETMGRLEKRDYESGDYEGEFEDTAISERWTDREKGAALTRNAMAVKSRKIFDAMRMNSFRDVDDEQEDLRTNFGGPPLMRRNSCPRYEEIKEYLFANRGPLELALDTMGILPFFLPVYQRQRRYFSHPHEIWKLSWECELEERIVHVRHPI
jgi:hypothetical protein